jgi:Na+/H+-dicarboxylate symporter
MGLYRAFMKFTRWYGRLITSAAAGLMAAIFLCLGGGKLLGASDRVMAVLIVLAVPLWIVVSVLSYKALKPRLEGRE